MNDREAAMRAQLAALQAENDRLREQIAEHSSRATCHDFIDYEEEIDNLCVYADIDQSYGYDLKLEKLSEFIKAAKERERSTSTTESDPSVGDIAAAIHACPMSACECPCHDVIPDVPADHSSRSQHGHPTCSLYCEVCRKMVTADRINGDLVCQECGGNPTPESTHGEEDSQ